MNILYRDPWLVAVYKPCGLLVHRSRIDREADRFALQLVRDQLGRRVYPVHRLDKATDGVLLFALDPATAGALTSAFQARRVAKTYVAVVRGYTAEAGVIDHPLRERLEPCTDALARTDKAPQSAITEYRRLATRELPWPVDRYPTARYSLVTLRPRTGRKHQLRRHLKHIAHPIVGDTTYGKGPHNRLFRDRLRCHRLLLSAVELTLPHPRTGTRLTLCAQLDTSFSEVLEGLGWDAAYRDWHRRLTAAGEIGPMG
jgi:tRNA pseudouridine65 synthase